MVTEVSDNGNIKNRYSITLTTIKYESGSVEFDGTTDFIQVPLTVHAHR